MSGGLRVALFDLDGTLIPGQSYRTLLETARDVGFRPARVRAMLIKRLPGHAARSLGLVNRLSNQRAWAESIAWLLAGTTVEDGVDLFHEAALRIERMVRPELLEAMMARRRDGCAVLLASTVVDRFLSHIAELVMADGFVGTPLEVGGDMYTGRFTGPVCQGDEKVKAIEALVGDPSLIDWAGSHAYSDGWPDLPMLERVGHPVAVAPDRQLRSRAEAAGWRIIG